MLRGNSIHIYHIYSPIVIDLGVVQGVSYWNGSLKRLKKWPDISVSDDVRQILNINPVISGFVSNLNLIRKIASQSKFCKLVIVMQKFHLTPFKCQVILKCQTIGHDAPHWKPIFFPEVWCTALHMVHFDTISSGFLMELTNLLNIFLT